MYVHLCLTPLVGVNLSWPLPTFFSLHLFVLVNGDRWAWGRAAGKVNYNQGVSVRATTDPTRSTPRGIGSLLTPALAHICGICADLLPDRSPAAKPDCSPAAKQGMAAPEKKHIIQQICGATFILFICRIRCQVSVSISNVCLWNSKVVQLQLLFKVREVYKAFTV